MTQQFIFGLAGEEDLNLGGGTFTVTLPDGGVVTTYHQIGSHTFLNGIRNTIENGCVGDGTTDDRAALNTLANSTLQPNGGTIFFAAPYTYRISSNISFPANVNLWFASGAKLSIDTGRVVTINGLISAGRSQIFSGLGSVSIGATAPVSECQPKWWGAAEDGVTDDTLSVRAAIAQGKKCYFPGSYKLTDAITLATNGQILRGDGRTVSRFIVGADFNLSAAGVFVASCGEPGPQLMDLEIAFTQPDTAVRGNLVAYPTALVLAATGRFIIERIRITGAMNGIDMTGNSGGSFINLLEISSYQTAIHIDGSLDSVRLHQIHMWSFGMTANNLTIYQDTTFKGLLSGRCDDLYISQILGICGGGILKFVQTASGTTFGRIVGLDCDSFAGIVMQAGDISVTGGYFTAIDSSIQAIVQTGGRLVVSDSKFIDGAVATNPFVSLSGAGTILSGYLSISNCQFQLIGDSTLAEVKASSGSNVLIMIGNQFIAPQSTSPTKPMVSQLSGGRITFLGNRCTDKGSGSGNLLTIATDDLHVIDNNVLEGWTITIPAAAVSLLAPSGPWVSYTPVVTAGSSTFTSAAATGLYKLKGMEVEFIITVTITTNGGAGTAVIASLPILPAAGSVAQADNTTDNISLLGRIPSGDARVLMYKYDGTYPGASGKVIVVSGAYKVA